MCVDFLSQETEYFNLVAQCNCNVSSINNLHCI